MTDQREPVPVRRQDRAPRPEDGGQSDLPQEPGSVVEQDEEGVRGGGG